jgi:ectoine hydroxylase-related dioxygenase (phytanoyl-CoA dioxygenase family)
MELEVQQFEEDGFTSLNDLIDIDLVESWRMIVEDAWKEVISIIESKNLHFGIGIKNGFKEIVQRHPQRFEMPYLIDNPVFNCILENERLITVVRDILKTNDFKVVNRSCVISLPGCDAQGWHTDGPHISVTEYLPCHCLNVFLPLIDIQEEHGPTEFRPGSQKYTNNLAKGMLLSFAKKNSKPIIAPLIKRGSALLVS